MTVMNIITEETINSKKIKDIETDRDLQISLIEEKFSIINQKFKEIYGCYIAHADKISNKEIEKKAKDILVKISSKKRSIRDAAAAAIEEIKAVERQAKINELDNLVNEICL